jgi:thiamine pyrophosphokinase
VRLLVAPQPDGAPAHLDLAGRVGDLVSLIPIDAALGVTTAGLRYALQDEELPAGPARGISNVRDGADAEIWLRRGRILVVEVPATLRG